MNSIHDTFINQDKTFAYNPFSLPIQLKDLGNWTSYSQTNPTLLAEEYPVYEEDEDYSRTSSEDNTELRAKSSVGKAKGSSVGVKVMNFERKVSNVRQRVY